MVAVEIDGVLDFRCGPAIRRSGRRRGREAVVTRRPDDTCSLNVEDATRVRACLGSIDEAAASFFPRRD